MKNSANFGTIAAKLIAAVMLFAALGRHAYDYFTLLRGHCLRCLCLHRISSCADEKIRLAVCFRRRCHCAKSNFSASFEARDLGTVDAVAAVLLLVSIAVMDIRKPRP